MARTARQLEIGGIYHIINRGVEQRVIFKDNQDYSRFILALECFNSLDPIELWLFFAPEIKAIGGSVPPKQKKATLVQRLAEFRRTPRKRLVDIFAFALMPSHFHLILREIIEGGISLFMKKIGGYTAYFNKRYKRVGPLFQSRYKAVSIKDDRQLAVVFNYVHTNPVELWEPGWKELEVKKANEALRGLKEYRFSSYRDYIGLPAFPNATQREFFLELFGGQKACQTEVENWVLYKAGQTEFDTRALE